MFKTTSAPNLQVAMAKVLYPMTVGDTVVVESLSRVGRCTKDLIELLPDHKARKQSKLLSVPAESKIQ